MKNVFKKTLLAIAILGLSSTVTYAQSKNSSRSKSTNSNKSSRTQSNKNARISTRSNSSQYNRTPSNVQTRRNSNNYAIRNQNRAVIRNNYIARNQNRSVVRNNRNRYVHNSVRVNRIPNGARHLYHKNVRYSHHNGVFYRSSGNAFVSVLPPVGLRLSILPIGFNRLAVNSRNYYYCSGVYYRDFNGGGYEVVQDPYANNYNNQGVVLDVLPNNYQVIESNGQVLFLSNGVYYEAISQGNGNVVYQSVQAPYGTTVDILPNGYQVVEFDGNVYFKVGNVYYKPISQQNGNVIYQVVYVF